MARCSNKEREYLDQLFQNNCDESIEMEILKERIPSKLKSDYREACKAFNSANAVLVKLQSELYSICNDNRMVSIIRELESDK